MKNLTAEELKSWINHNGKFSLIDVREEWERESYNIGGAHIPVAELMSRKQEISKEDPVVIYCEKGIRSSIVIQRLEPLGYDNLYNLSGGLKAWKAIS
jgi:rhodanese-related sulfurtransferase